MERLIRPDGRLRFRLRPGLDLSWAEGPKRGDWSGRIRTDAEGRRAPSLEAGDGPPLRIAFLGDSSTMGFYVDDAETYPLRCADALARELPARAIRAKNFGVMGYTSEQGRQLVLGELAKESFELVVIAFGYNDGFLTRRREDDWLSAVPPPGWLPAHEALSSFSALYRVLWLHSHPQRSHDVVRPRIPRERFAANLRTMIRAVHARGARAIVLDLAIPNGYLRETMHDLAREEGALHVATAALFERELQRSGPAEFLPLTLRAHRGAPTVRLRFRGLREPVLVAFEVAREERVAVVLPGRDDGACGDEVAGDGIFTWALPIPGNALSYELSFVELDYLRSSPEVLNYLLYRRVALEAGQGFDAPILDAEAWSLGWRELLLANEFVHPNPRGLELLGLELARVIAAATGG
ncbi:MAG: SGNH/GDSL hydrolase family protein [Planctomycetes bacterium]|nr:SGNH/GDSL hydrolase family protein [Planctomycetota bacterium]